MRLVVTVFNFQVLFTKALLRLCEVSIEAILRLYEGSVKAL